MSSPRHTYYYEILGLGTDATPEEIKKAYRQLSLRWHPDKNLDNKEETEEMFKLLAKAYEILSNAETRTLYDKYGEDGLNGKVKTKRSANTTKGNYQTNWSAFDIFNDVFGGRDPFDDPFFKNSFSEFNRTSQGMFRSATFNSFPNDLHNNNDLHNFAADPFFNDPFFSPSSSFSGHLNKNANRSGGGSNVTSTRISFGPNGAPIQTTIQRSETWNNGKRTVVTKSTNAQGHEVTEVIYPDGTRSSSSSNTSRHYLQ